MSEHAWVQDHIAVVVSGGLDAAEAERLNAHVRECSECAAALADARNLDRGLGALFTAVRPGPTAEDRLIRSLWIAPSRPVKRSRWPRRIMWGVAASVGLCGFGITGFAMTRFVGEDGLPLPGQDAIAGAMKKNPKSLGQVSDEGTVPRNRFGLLFDNSHSIRAEEAKQDRPAGSIVNGFYSDLAPTLTPPPVGFFRITNGTPDPDAMARQLREQTLAGALQEHGTGSLDTFARTSLSASELSRLRDGYNGIGPDGKPIRAGNIEPTPSRGPAPAGTIMQPPAQTPPVTFAANGVPASAGNTDPNLWSDVSGKTPQSDAFYFRPTENAWKVTPNFTPPTATSRMHTEAGKGVMDGLDQSKITTGGKQYKAPGIPDTPKSDPLALIVDPQPAVPPPNLPPVPEAAPVKKMIIRSGDIEFVVDSFDSAVATVTKLVNAIKNGSVNTVNSDKLENGKMKGTVVVRVPPESLDGLVLDLRKELGKGGELKGQKIGSQDITKQYTDLESRLKSDRTMEQRLLQIIKDGKGEIKQLLEAEKELGIVRTRIEQSEGEIRYYGSQVSLSTLTITLSEKEIKAAAGLTETEVVRTGVEVEDVEKALQDALAAVTEAKGRVTKSEMKQLAAGQFNAILNFEVAPAAAGPLRDRLRQIGRMARLEIERVQTAEAGTPQLDSKIKRGDTQFFVQLYNLATVTPREKAEVTVAAPDVPSAYQTLLEAVKGVKGRVIDAKVNEQDRQNVTAQLEFEIRRGDESAIQTALAAAGDVISRNVTRAPEGDNVTDSKIRFATKLESAARMKPRESVMLVIEVDNVDAAVANFTAQMAQMKGRTVESHVTHERNGMVSARLEYDVPLTAFASLTEQFKNSGTVRLQQATRDAQAPDGKLAIARIDVRLASTDLIVPKDDGFALQVRTGLMWSAKVLMAMVSWIIVGACVIVPWALVIYGIYRLVRRMRR